MSEDNKIIYWARLYDTREDFPGSGMDPDKPYRGESSHETLASAKKALLKMVKDIDPNEYGRVEKIEYEWETEFHRWQRIQTMSTWSPDGRSRCLITSTIMPTTYMEMWKALFRKFLT